jgi:hypothetical protein
LKGKLSSIGGSVLKGSFLTFETKRREENSVFLDGCRRAYSLFTLALFGFAVPKSTSGAQLGFVLYKYRLNYVTGLARRGAANLLGMGDGRRHDEILDLLVGTRR